MKRLQFLIASQIITAARKPTRAPSQRNFTNATNNSDTGIPFNLEALDASQLNDLRQCTYKKLCRERRLCSARAKSYDLNNHIRLYLMHKHLAQHS